MSIFLRGYKFLLGDILHPGSGWGGVGCISVVGGSGGSTMYIVVIIIIRRENN